MCARFQALPPTVPVQRLSDFRWFSGTAESYGLQHVDYYPNSLLNFFKDSGGAPTALSTAMAQAICIKIDEF